MKKNIVIIVLLIVITILSIKLLTINQYDTNRDGKVDIKDLLRLQKYLIEKGDDK